MTQEIPKVSQYMTKAPEYINSEANIYEAMELMQKKDIRHLPVEKEKKIIGLISERDIKTLFALVGANFKTVKVGDVCAEWPYIAHPDTPINVVAADMATQKLGSALILDNGKLIGIFTATDACRALSEIFVNELKN